MNSRYEANKRHYQKYCQTDKGKETRARAGVKTNARKLADLGYTPAEIIAVLFEALNVKEAV